MLNISGAVLLPCISAVGKIVTPIISWILKHLLIGALLNVNTGSTWVGLGAILGLSVSLAASVLDKLIIEPLKVWWDKPILPSAQIHKTTYSRVLPKMRLEKISFDKSSGTSINSEPLNTLKESPLMPIEYSDEEDKLEEYESLTEEELSDSDSEDVVSAITDGEPGLFQTAPSARRVSCI